MYRTSRKDATTGDSVRSICADDDLRSEVALICFDHNAVFLRENLFYRNPLSNLQSSSLCFSCQPVVKLITTDDSQSMPARETDCQSFCFERKMDAVGIHMRDFAHIQTQPLKDDLGIDDEAASAKLEARITCFFQDQDAGRELWKVTRKMKCSGEPAGTSTDDNNVTLKHGM